MKAFYSQHRGIQLITWQGVLALMIFPTVFVSRLPTQDLDVDTGFLVACLFVFQLFYGSLLLLAGKTIFRNTANMRVWWASIFATFAAGFAYVFSVRYAVTVASGVHPDAEKVIHVSVMALGYAFWMLLVGVAVSNTEKFRQSFELLQKKISEKRVIEFEQAIRLDALKTEVATELVSSLSVLLEEDRDFKDAIKLKSRLSDINVKILRPLSRALSRRPLTQTNLISSKYFEPARKISALSALQKTGEVGPFDHKFAPILAAVISYLSKTWILSSLGAFTSVIVSFVVLKVMILAAAKIYEKVRHRLNRMTRAAVVIGTYSLIVATDLILFRLIFGEHSIAKGISVLFAEIIAILVAGIIRGTAIERENTIRELEDQAQNIEWAVARTGQLIWVEHQRLSRLLHGDVQARVVAAASQLSTSGEGQINQAKLDALISDCLAAIDAPVQRQSLRALVADLANLWSASIALHFDCDAKAETRLGHDLDAEASVEEIIRECITNAAKHGNASNIWIEVRLPEESAKYVQVFVSNDGQELAPIANVGQGSQLLNQVSLEWSRLSAHGKTVISAKVPIK